MFLKLESHVYLEKISNITFKTRGPYRVYKRSITDRISRRIARLALKLRRVSLQDLIDHLDLNPSKKTVTLHLKHLEIQKRIARTKSYLSSQHMTGRLEWTKVYKTWTIFDWVKIIWSDESSIQMRFDSWQTLVFRRDDEEYNSECLCLSFKSKCINIMSRGCFAWNLLESLIICESREIGSERFCRKDCCHLWMTCLI